MFQIRDTGIAIRDNVIVTLEDVITGEKQVYTQHNTVESYALDALAQWLAGVNNTGYNPVAWPTQMQLGIGSGTTFVSVSGTLKTISYAQWQGPGSGQMQAVCQWVESDPSGTFTQAQWLDTNLNPWFFVNFSDPISKSSTQNLTLQWTVTFANGTSGS